MTGPAHPREPTLAAALSTVDDWSADHVAAALVGPDGILAAHGDADRPFRWASVTKLVTAMAVLTAVAEGTLTEARFHSATHDVLLRRRWEGKHFLTRVGRAGWSGRTRSG